MRSLAVLDPAPPGRGIRAANSSVLSTQTPRLWNPNVFLNVASACCLPAEWARVMVPSTRSMAVAPMLTPPAYVAAGTPWGRWLHRCARAAARAASMRYRPASLISPSAQRGGVRRDRPEHHGLGPQRLDVVQVDASGGDRAGHVGQHPAPVVHRVEAGLGQYPRQAPGQPGAVGQHPQPDHP